AGWVTTAASWPRMSRPTALPTRSFSPSRRFPPRFSSGRWGRPADLSLRRIYFLARLRNAGVGRSQGMSSTTLALPERRHFALPAIIVLGALAALFFGFTKVPSMVPTARPLHQVDKSDETTVSVSVEKLDNSGEPAGPSVGSPPIKQPDIPNPIPNDNRVTMVPIEPGPIGGLPNVSVPGPWFDGIGGP